MVRVKIKAREHVRFRLIIFNVKTRVKVKVKSKPKVKVGNGVSQGSQIVWRVVFGVRVKVKVNFRVIVFFIFLLYQGIYGYSTSFFFSCYAFFWIESMLLTQYM